MSQIEYGLLAAFRGLFDGVRYNHRDSSLGDRVALHLNEDLFRLGKSAKLVQGVKSKERVVNVQNRVFGKEGRRGDGTFGEIVPTALAINEEGFQVARGPVATIEIGAETKILAKAMIKQIDRVIGDLCRQTEEFKSRSRNAICVSLVGVNFSAVYTSYEGDREFLTDGKKQKHPIQEADTAILRLRSRAQPAFDEFLILKFAATNVAPFPFYWIEEHNLILEYGAMLTRISREYDRRF